jgi:hypothetical protein
MGVQELSSNVLLRRVPPHAEAERGQKDSRGRAVNRKKRLRSDRVCRETILQEREDEDTEEACLDVGWHR